MLLPSLILGLVVQAPPTPIVCPPQGSARADLEALRGQGFDVPDDAKRHSLALGLVACLESPDPGLRDRIAFEALSTWLRAGKLDGATLRTLRVALIARVRGPEDEAGFRIPFAILALSEVARVDRVAATFSDVELSELVDVGAEGLRRIRDYRGLDDTQGWRHGVAHAADLALQLTLNPRVGAADLRKLLGAVATQIAPGGAVFYTDSEPERLARPVLYAWRRGGLDAGFWEAWFSALSDPAPLKTWGAAFESRAGLAQRHNRLAFLNALSFAARSAGDETGLALGARADKTAGRLMAN